MIINLEVVIHDDLQGYWFHHLRSRDFAWFHRIANIREINVENDDFIIHKYVIPGDRYPSVRYHQILGDEAFEVSGNNVRGSLSEKLIDFIISNDSYPIGCEFVQIFKNGNIKVKYLPADMEFTLKLLKLSIQKIPILAQINDNDKIEEYFTNMVTYGKELEIPSVKLKKIKPLKSAPIIEYIAMENGENNVYVNEAEIVAIEKCKSYFRGRENVFYIIEASGGTAKTDGGDYSLVRTLEKSIVKCSEKLMNKKKLQIGHFISFKSTFKDDPKMGKILQKIYTIKVNNPESDDSALLLIEENKDYESNEYFDRLLPNSQANFQKRIVKMSSSPIPQSMKNKGRILISNAEIVNINLRNYVFHDSQVDYFLLQTKGGTAETIPKRKKDAVIKHDLESAVIRCSSNAMYEHNVVIGTRITCRSTIENNRYSGYILRNLRKISIDDFIMENWTPDKTFRRIMSNQSLRKVDTNHPKFSEYFPVLDVSDPVMLQKYRDWGPNVVIEKLKNNTYPDEFDLKHYLFLTTWSDIRRLIKDNNIDNDTTNKFLKYLDDRFSVEKEDGFKILL